MDILEDLPNAIPVINGPRVTLRPFTEDDIPEREMWARDPAINFLLSGRTSPDDFEVTEWWECHKDNPYTAVLVIESPEKEYIGDIDFYVENLARRTCGLTILIGRREYWSMGYGTEAIRLLLEFAFRELGLSAVLLNVFEFNRSAVRCYEKCGFRQIDSVEQAFEHSGKQWRWITMQCTPETFRMPDSETP